MEPTLVKPSEALNRQFELDDEYTLSLQSVNSEEGNINHEAETTLFHGFTIGDIGFLLPRETTSEVFDNLAYCKLPKTPTALIGVANVRGDIIPLFDLRRLFSLGKSFSTPKRFLVVGTGEQAVGFCLEELPVQMSFSADNVLKSFPPLPENLRPYVRTCYQSDGVWVDWDIIQCLKT